MFRFTIRELVLVTVIVAMACGWRLEHTSNAPLRKRCSRLEGLAKASVQTLEELGVHASFRDDNIFIGGSSWSSDMPPWNPKSSTLIEP